MPRKSGRYTPREKSEYDERLVDIARVARIVAGGRRFNFRVALLIGNHKGKIGLGVAKGADVSLAREKAMRQAKKNLLTLDLAEQTIHHQITGKYGSALVLLKPASEGTGIIAGGAVRTVAELAGIRNIVSKILGSSSKINNIKATLIGLRKIASPKDIAHRRGISIEKVLPPVKSDPAKTANSQELMANKNIN